MKSTDLETVRTLVLGLWPKALSAQIAVLLEKIENYDRDQVCVIVREVAMQPHKGFLDACGKIVGMCRATKEKYIGEPASVVNIDEEAKEGTKPGELCDAAYAGTLDWPCKSQPTPRGLAWMRAIGEKRARARAEGREPFEPSGSELIFAATSMGQSRLGKPSKRDMEGATG